MEAAGLFSSNLVCPYSMKLFICLVTLSAFLSAAPVGNPAFPELLKQGFCIPSTSCVNLRLGYEGDFIGDARMNQSEEGSGRVDNFRQDTNSGIVTLNFVERLDLYGVFGSTRICADWRFSGVGTVNRAQVETGYEFLWGVGARAALYEWGNTTLGIGGRYSSSHPNPNWITINGTPESISGATLHWYEWQADLDLSYQIDLFIPYVGVKYLSAKARTGVYPESISSSGSGTLHMRNRTPVGIVVGCTLTTGKYFMLNVEGRLIDEEAATISGDLRF